jgi:hypothetical protein
MDLRSIAAGKINFDTMNYAKNDPACCPTRKGKTRFTLVRGKLKEIR